MLEVDQVRECKRLHAKGMGLRAIAREMDVSRNTVRRYVRGERQPGEYRLKQRRRQPRQEAVRDRVRDLLTKEREAETPRRQRLTAARIHRLLTAECAVSVTTVRRVVAGVRRELEDPLDRAFLTFEYEPGRDAQVDFFEAVYDDTVAGRVKVFGLLVRACYSARTYLYVAPNQTRESLLEGLMRAFEAFGGAFQTVWFDNLTPAVRKVLAGRTREMQTAFARFEAHYGFKAEFCRPGMGHEKGGVEGEVKFSRHEVFSPIPQVGGRQAVQEIADRWMASDLDRTTAGRSEPIGTLWKHEVPHLIPLPSARFDPSLVRPTKVSPRSWVQYANNHYSVPVAWVGEPVDLRASAEAIEIRRRNGEAVTHARRYGRGEMALELEHYLPLLERKHRGLDRAIPVRRWLERVSPGWTSLLRTLRAREGEIQGSKAFIAVLRMTEAWGVDIVTGAVERALRHPELSVGTVRYFLGKATEASRPTPPASIPVDGPTVLERSTREFVALLRSRVAS